MHVTSRLNTRCLPIVCLRSIPIYEVYCVCMHCSAFMFAEMCCGSRTDADLLL